MFVSSLLAALLLGAAAEAQPSSGSVVSETTCAGKTYTYKELAGYGRLPGNMTDKFGDTLAGIGSSSAAEPSAWTKHRNGSYTGITWTLPDRGWNTQGTLNFQPRVHKFFMLFIPAPDATVDDPSPPNLELFYLDSIAFTGPDGEPMTGLDADVTGSITYPGFPDMPVTHFEGDGFGGDGPGGTRIPMDPEGLVLGKHGSFWISDEYGPFIYHFDCDGKMIGAIRPPEAYIPRRNGTVSFSANSPPVYDPDRDVEPSEPDTGRNTNQGLEALTASPDGKYLYSMIQSGMNQEGGDEDETRRYARVLQYDISCDPPTYRAEWVVSLPLYDDGEETAGQSEIKFISDTQFLVLARDGDAGRGLEETESLYRHLDVFDISEATDVKDPQYDCATCGVASRDGELDEGITVAKYCPWLDFNINAELGKFGLHNGGEQDDGLLNEKWEGLNLLPVETEPHEWSGCDDYYLFAYSDNDFITQHGFMNGGALPYSDESGFELYNQVLVFKVSIPRHSNPLLG
ncbi:3-phytase [Lineolata rhizophorae]|uniref:3-phytase n=1 Tax=Lineolata rhizophorae TaxID=578093 RepID=A0A6A6P352_9PEZI|nr:3-phytase [Lineolata rhizophorae]